MAKKVLLVVDADNLCHRARHSGVGRLRYKGEGVGTIVGFFNQILALANRLPSADVAFCFDHKPYLRSQISERYKAEREGRPPMTMAKDDSVEFRQQVESIRDHWLERLGCPNACYAPGYEADDCIASIVDNNSGRYDLTGLVSTDKDLYQLLGQKVALMNRTEAFWYTAGQFFDEYALPPVYWPQIIALAGKPQSMSLRGVDGVGPFKAAKFLANTLPKSAKVFDDIVRFLQTEDYRRNLKLLTLPYPGTPVFQVAHWPWEPDKEGWQELCDHIGRRDLRREMV